MVVEHAIAVDGNLLWHLLSRVGYTCVSARPLIGCSRAGVKGIRSHVLNPCDSVVRVIFMVLLLSYSTLSLDFMMILLR